MILHHRGFPIRTSTGQSLFPAHRGFSQVVTSFFGSWCQGIHLMLFFAWTAPLAFVLSRFASCLSFANNCLGCGLLKRPCFFEFHCFHPSLFNSNGKIVLSLCNKSCLQLFPLISERPSNLTIKKSSQYNYLFVSFFLYSVFNEHLLCWRTSRIRLRVSHLPCNFRCW